MGFLGNVIAGIAVSVGSALVYKCVTKIYGSIRKSGTPSPGFLCYARVYPMQGDSYKERSSYIPQYEVPHTPLTLGDTSPVEEEFNPLLHDPVGIEWECISTQFVKRIDACFRGLSLLGPREALFMLAEQLANLEGRISADYDVGIHGLFRVVEMGLSGGDEAAMPVAKEIQRSILSGKLCL